MAVQTLEFLMEAVIVYKKNYNLLPAATLYFSILLFVTVCGNSQQPPIVFRSSA